MKERNQKQRRHIRAARQWLGEAEHSLAENHRVRGELKVMLAKAEWITIGSIFQYLA